MLRVVSKSRIFCFGAALSLLTFLWAGQALAVFSSSESFGQVAQQIQKMVSLKSRESGFSCRGERICGIQLLPAFYVQRQYQPVWLDEQGIRPTALALVSAISSAGEDGLDPSDYHIDAIEEIRAAVAGGKSLLYGRTAEQWAEFDILLTDAFLLFCSHLSGGRVNPETLHNDWVISAPTVDMMALLHTVATETQLNRAIDQLRPSQSGYVHLRTHLYRLRQVASSGGWPRIPEGETLRPGDRHERILALRHRLMADGSLLPDDQLEAPERFDENLVATVKRFQLRNGLKADGLVGSQTLAALNISAGQRIRQVELNLERWRWLPDSLGDRYISVNTADFTMRVVENNRTVLEMPVIVGKPARQTPVFSSQMSYMVVNPDWTVPFTIAVEDMLPKALEDPDYFEKQGISVYWGWDEKAPPINPRHVDWRAYGFNNFPFRFLQAPGPTNALGRFKFMFPNKFAVYLHDTPHRAHFDLVKRDFSSGCIRVADAVALAEYLLRDNPGWSSQRLASVLKSGESQTIHINQPIWVHLLYMTAWVDQEGVLQFRRDIYDRDTDLERALAGRPPRPLPTNGTLILTGGATP